MLEVNLCDVALNELATALAAELKAHGCRLATAESCTGGWIAKVCTDLAGSSGWFERGFVTYSDESKCDLLGVPAAMLERYGAVSEPVAEAMVEGALSRSQADRAVAVTGVAGPDGGSAEKPVGTVCFGWAGRGDAVVTETKLFAGDRETVRCQTVAHALEGLLRPEGG